MAGIENHVGDASAMGAVSGGYDFRMFQVTKNHTSFLFVK
jgi:hypothetical protein